MRLSACLQSVVCAIAWPPPTCADDARHMLHGQSATSLPVVDGTVRCCGTVRSQHLERVRTP